MKITNSIMNLEHELKDNQKRILFIQDKKEIDPAGMNLRLLLLERNSIKDKLLNAYRKLFGA